MYPKIYLVTQTSSTRHLRLLPDMIQPLLVVAVVAILLLFWLKALGNLHHAQNEPPVVAQRVPLIGHLIGMLRFGSHYYTRVRYVMYLAMIIT
jgi:hypothetical protein